MRLNFPSHVDDDEMPSVGKNWERVKKTIHREEWGDWEKILAEKQV